MEQGSDEWKHIRLGKLTASRVSDMMAKTKTGWGASQANLMAQLIVERLTGQPQESYTNAAMQWGNDREPEARAAYAFMRDIDVAQEAFVDHPTIANAGASPDGLVGDDGLLEIKCPNSATHIDYLLSDKIDDKYIKQMQWQMACTGRKWCDWMTYDPRMPTNLQIKIVRVDRDDAMISEIEAEGIKFLAEIDEKIKKLKELQQ
jgi:putative phage-type endonuclease